MEGHALIKPGGKLPPVSARPPRPEQEFFEDPAVDRLLGVVMALATEHFVLRQRVRALESARAAADTPVAPDAGRGVARMTGLDDASDADAFAKTLLQPMLGLQESVGAQAGPRASRRTGGRGKAK